LALAPRKHGRPPGKGGIGPITAPDASEFNCRIAGQVKDYDPLKWVDRKDARKTGRFIQFATRQRDGRPARLEVKNGDAHRVGAT
jgi:3-oxoacyl-[acyl-carrier-protein] synthase II